MFKTNEPTEAQILASLISGTGKIEVIATQRAISARIDLTTLARVDSMAQQAKKSRNEMINMLLSVGCDEVYQHLKGPVIEELQSREMVALQSSLTSEE